MEPALAPHWRAPVTPAILIMHGKHGQPDAGRLGGRHDAFSHLGSVVIGVAIVGMMQIVKFHIGGIARLQHFHLHQCGNGFNMIWRQLVKEQIHQRTPCPKTVCGIVTAMLSQSGHRALKGVAMGVHRGWQKAGNVGFGCGIGNIRGYRGDSPIIAKFDKDIFRPAIRQKCSVSVNFWHQRFLLTGYYVCTY